jgi:hypothetical protein
MNQVLPVVRLQLVNWRFGLGMPLGILTMVFALNLGLFGSMGDVIPPDGRMTGAIMSIYVVVGVGLLQTMTQTFPFALGMSVTRRAFLAGVALLAAAEALGFGALLLVLNLVERASGGWGLGLKFFALDFMTVDSPALQWLVFVVPFLVFAAVGVFTGVVFKRWGQPGVYGVVVAASVALGGLAVLITWRGGWPAVGGWFADQPVAALFAGYPLILVVLLGGASWLAIRRATP